MADRAQPAACSSLSRIRIREGGQALARCVFFAEGLQPAACSILMRGEGSHGGCITCIRAAGRAACTLMGGKGLHPARSCQQPTKHEMDSLAFPVSWMAGYPRPGKVCRHSVCSVLTDLMIDWETGPSAAIATADVLCITNSRNLARVVSSRVRWTFCRLVSGRVRPQ